MELDHSGFSTQYPTVCAANLGEGRYILQVSTVKGRGRKGGWEGGRKKRKVGDSEEVRVEGDTETDRRTNKRWGSRTESRINRFKTSDFVFYYLIKVTPMGVRLLDGSEYDDNLFVSRDIVLCVI